MFITVGVSGKIEGRIIYRIDRLSALKLSGVMLGTTIRTMDRMSESALSELANIISGATLSSGNFNSLDVDMYPPTIFQGSVMTFNSLKMDIVHLPYTFTGGKLDVFIAIEDYNI
jgi:chemotaxis protein CheX